MGSLVFQIDEKLVSGEEFPVRAQGLVHDIAKNFSFYCKGEYGVDPGEVVILPPSISGDPDNPHREIQGHLKTTVSYLHPEKPDRRFSLYFYSDPSFQFFTPGPTDPISAECYCRLEHQHPLIEFEERQNTYGKVIEVIPTPEGVIYSQKGILYTRQCYEESLNRAQNASRILTDEAVSSVFSLKFPSVILSKVMNEVLSQVDQRNYQAEAEEETNVLHFESVVPVNSVGFFEVNLFTLVGPRLDLRKRESSVLSGKFFHESHLVGVTLSPHGFLKTEWMDVEIKAA